MFQKILLATDGSHFADHAADATLAMATQLSGVEVVLLHVSSEPPSRSELLQAGMDVQFLLKENAQKLLATTEEKFTRAEVSYSLQVALGDPADLIVKVSEEQNIDLIIIGSRGLGSVTSLLLGSVSRRVAQEASCPVMIVKA